jgi:hypothetical protein
MIRAVLAELPDELRRRLAFVNIEHRPHLTPDDVARGATPEHRGYFYGDHADAHDPDSSALPDEQPPRGTIVLFTSPPFELEELARVLLHEIGHALGYDHDVLEEMGVA